MGPMSGASLFDRVVMVDWSANSTPKRGRDSIWIGDSRSHEAVNPSTRSAAMALIRAVCAESIDERVLIGFDFSFGYPAGFARALTGSSAWSSLWSLSPPPPPPLLPLQLPMMTVYEFVDD